MYLRRCSKNQVLFTDIKTGVLSKDKGKERRHHDSQIVVVEF